MEYTLNQFTISTDKSRLDIRLIHDYLSNTAYWSKGRSLETVEKSIEHSLCFGVYQEDQPSHYQENAASLNTIPQNFPSVLRDRRDPSLNRSGPGCKSRSHRRRGRQVGFARVITDYATFAWLCDVFILDTYQGQGLGKWLVACVMNHPELASLRLIILATRDAHELYRKYGGFETVDKPERMMFRRIKDS